ncbi:MAG: anti-sigma factor family protein [Gammaproteobacteria bacterium]
MNGNRTIDDTMLSAYIDGELPPQDADDVRAAVDADPLLAERLAALRSVDALVARHARALDDTPLPSSVLEMLQAEAAPQATVPAANVVRGPWQRWTRASGLHLALAASLVLALGLVLTKPFAPLPTDLPPLAAYAPQLDTSPSGTTVAIDGAALTNRFTFTDHDGRHCRQYQLNNADGGSENVACRDAAGWTLVASLPTPAQEAPDLYQPASSSAELNALLDAMMAGPALDAEAEAALIERNWQGD